MSMAEKRWRAVVTYRSETGVRRFVHEIEEIEEMADIIEQGPHWSCLVDVRITLARTLPGTPETIEAAEREGGRRPLLREVS